MEEKEEQTKTQEELKEIMEKNEPELTYEQQCDKELEGEAELEDWNFD